MAAFRLTTPVMAVFLLPLIGRRPSDWLRFIAGAAPFPVALALYNTVAFGAPWKQGYGSAHVTSAAKLGSGRVLDGIPGLLVSPGRGLLLYSPVLLFAIAGAVIGRRQALYRWCAAAFVAYLIVVANVAQWWGGEGFGARKLAEALPLLAVLLVPAVDAIVRRKWLGIPRLPRVVGPRRGSRRRRLAGRVVREARSDRDIDLVASVRQRDSRGPRRGRHRREARADSADLRTRARRGGHGERPLGQRQYVVASTPA